MYQPKTGEKCSCKPGIQRDNCPHCEGTGMKIDFAKIRGRKEIRGPLDLTGDIIAYESGELDDEATVELFQHLIDTGLAWSLQGHYGRTAKALIEAGHCQPKGEL